ELAHLKQTRPRVERLLGLIVNRYHASKTRYRGARKAPSKPSGPPSLSISTRAEPPSAPSPPDELRQLPNRCLGPSTEPSTSRASRTATRRRRDNFSGLVEKQIIGARLPDVIGGRRRPR